MNYKSYSPSINKNIEIKSLKTLSKEEINTCNNLLKINVGTKKKPKCLNYNNLKVKNLLLKNLKASKYLDAKFFIAPKQLMANCWFNTMFVTFFFSDKGRKFFRFFREFMIKGIKINGEKIKNKKIEKLLFILNLFIEASYNQNNLKLNNKNTIKNKKDIKDKKDKKNKKDKNKKTRKNIKINETLYDQIKILTNNLNTNYFIKEIYDEINNSKINNSYYSNIQNINDAGNPIMYYKSLIKYLNYDILKIIEMDIKDKININDFLINKYEYYESIPEILIINDLESKSHYEITYNLKNKNNNYIYKLDSIIMTNKDFFKINSNKHFVSVNTINNKEYKFDGDSYSRLSKFNWKKLINVNKDWEFLENKHYYPEKYNFTKGYKILFYYREK